jgi:hypothetical protein
LEIDMPSITEDRLLKATRLFLLLIMGLMAFAAIVLMVVAAILPFYWTEAAAEIAKEHPLLNADALYPRLYAIFALGMLILGGVFTIMRKLLAIVDSVALGDPFVRTNAERLRTIGWLMAAVQVGGIPLAIVASKTADLFGKNDVDMDVSLNGILAILLVFVLAGIFDRGAAMREELEGTV